MRVNGRSRVNPARRMPQDVELPGPVAEDQQIGRDALLDQATEQGSFRGDPHHPLGVQAQGCQPGLPGRFVGKP